MTGTVAAARPGAGSGVVIGLLGPTTVGKTAVAVALARILGVGVISCDSMQLYRGFPVLTNQPTAEELGGVVQALVGVVEPTESFSVAEYAALARPLIAADVAATGAAVVVGGTGLYLRAALAPLQVAAGDPERRARLEARAAAEGAGVLHAELARIDPAAAEAIDPRNARRVIRALEVVTTGGEGWSGRNDLWQPLYDHPTCVVGLTMARDALHARIGLRASQMVERGAVDEVRRFREEHGRDATAPGRAGICSAIGYREICGCLDGELSLPETVAGMAAATRRYARRQLTWLRRVRGAVIIDVHDRDAEQMAREILDHALAEPITKEPRRR